jgi:hypothetical protein
LGVDARQIGGALAIADAVDGSAEGRSVEQKNRSRANDGPDDQRIGQAECQIARGQAKEMATGRSDFFSNPSDSFGCALTGVASFGEPRTVVKHRGGHPNI